MPKERRQFAFLLLNYEERIRENYRADTKVAVVSAVCGSVSVKLFPFADGYGCVGDWVC